jgi:hypothetical protein
MKAKGPGQCKLLPKPIQKVNNSQAQKDLTNAMVSLCPLPTLQNKYLVNKNVIKCIFFTPKIHKHVE